MNTENKSHTPKEIRDLWQTPPKFFKFLDNEFKFLIDIAASRYNHLAPLYMDEEMNALGDVVWPAVPIWCNPPYSDITPWVEKAAEAARHGATVVMLVPADTSVKWFNKAWETATEMRFISGRISFINADTGEPVNGNNKGSVLIVWRPGERISGAPVVNLVARDDYLQG